MLKDRLSQYPEIYDMIAHCGQCYIQPIFNEDKLWLVAENSTKIGRISVARDLNVQILNEIGKLSFFAVNNGFQIIPQLPTVEPLITPTNSWTIEDLFTIPTNFKLISKYDRTKFYVHREALDMYSSHCYQNIDVTDNISGDKDTIMMAIRMIYQLPQNKDAKMDYEKLYELFEDLGLNKLSKKCKNMLIEEKNYLALLRLNLL